MLLPQPRKLLVSNFPGSHRGGPDDVALLELALEYRATQLAPMLGCSRATVPSRLAAARQRLRAVA